MFKTILTLFIAGTILSETKDRIVPAEKYVWNWRDAIVMKAMTDIYDDEPELRPDIAAWAQTAMENCLTKVHGTHPNGIASGVGLAFLKRIGLDHDGEYSRAYEKIYSQYRQIKRYEGATSHRPSRIELWDDTVYMLAIYLIEMYRATGDGRYLEDCIREVIGHAGKLRDEETGLWWHGWSATNYCYVDDCCEYLWNSNNLQRNTEFWGRGNGWIAMSLADLLSIMPEDHKDYRTLLGWYTRMMQTLCQFQDTGTGHWRQLPLRKEDADNGNFIESSGTAMFGYALAKGLNRKLLKGGRYVRAARLAFDGLQKNSMVRSNDGSISMTNICAGTCIGEREYYYGRDVVCDESFAVGAYLLFENQMKHKKF